MHQGELLLEACNTSKTILYAGRNESAEAFNALVYSVNQSLSSSTRHLSLPIYCPPCKITKPPGRVASTDGNTRPGGFWSFVKQ